MSEINRVAEMLANSFQDNGEEFIENPERGCGFAKADQAYIRLDWVPWHPGYGDELERLPVFVEIESEANRIPYKGDHFRNYRWIPGLNFELALIEAAADLGPSSSPMELVSALKNNEITDPPGEVWEHIRRLGGSEAEDIDDQFHHITAGTAHDLLMWVGESYYGTPREFIEEAKREGLNKAIPVSQGQEPPTINPGKTRVWLIHPKGKTAPRENLDGLGVETLDHVAGVGAKTAERLREAGYKTVRHVRDASVTELTDLGGIGEDIAQRLREADVYIPAIIGYSYLSRIIYTRDVDGKVPEYVEQWDATGMVDVVNIGPAEPYDADQTELPEFEGHTEEVES